MVTKAVLIGEDGKEEIVGAAGWSFHLGREDAIVAGEEGEKNDGEGKEELEDGGGWGEGSNAKLCEDVFLGAEKMFDASTEGRNYASEFALFCLFYCETESG